MRGWILFFIIKDTLHSIHKQSADVINKLSVPNALYGQLLCCQFTSPTPSLSLSSNVSVHVCVCVCVCENVCDLVLRPSLIRLELSIDQSGLRVEIKVFLSLDNPVVRWKCRREVGKINTLGHMWPFVTSFQPSRRVLWLRLLCCNVRKMKFRTDNY